ncbi:hypothetical protein [Azorhizobium sp. AG788]|uniref:hypothetical protein n=1 Tax=Azorhizobium sp. AG788 TaxID=2183897 RepID=UPI003138981F
MSVRNAIKPPPNPRAYDDFLSRKVAAARESVRIGEGRSNDEVEATFAARRDAVRRG